MDTLRWILLILGLLVIAGLYGFYRWQEAKSAGGVRGVRPARRQRAKRGSRPRERDVDDALRALDDLVIDDPDDRLDDLVIPPADDAIGESASRPAWDAEQARADGILSPPRVRHRAPATTDSQPDQAATREPAAEPRWDGVDQGAEPAPPAPEPSAEAGRNDEMAVDDVISAPRRRTTPAPASSDAPRRPVQQDFLADVPDTTEEDTYAYQDAGEKIVVLHVTAGEGYCFVGPAIMTVAQKIGLVLDEQRIFRRYPGGDRHRTALFGVASMVEPGVFDPDGIDELETPGLALFLQLPAPFDGLSAFEEMLETGRRLADSLDGHLLDARRCDLTQQAVEHIREDLREYRRRAHLAARRKQAR